MFDQFKADYDRDGFVIVRQFLPKSDTDLLIQNLDRYIRDIVPTLPDSDAFYVDKSRPETLKQLQHMGLDPFFRDYAQHPIWRALARTLVGEDVNAQEPEWFNKPCGTISPTPPHQDNYYFCLKPANVVTLWLALDLVDEENGCLRYVKGSHLRGIRAHDRTSVLGFSQGISDYGDRDRELEVPIHLQPGDVVAHHGDTIHRAEPNRSATRHRRAFAMVFKGVSCQRDQDAYSRYEAALAQQHQGLGLRK